MSKDEVKELSFLRSYWTDEKLDEGEQFLRDYILNRKYVEGKDSNTKNDDDDETRNYNQIAHDSDEGGLSNDEQFEEQREEFEHKYNFRFEEPDPEFVSETKTILDSKKYNTFISNKLFNISRSNAFPVRSMTPSGVKTNVEKNNVTLLKIAKLRQRTANENKSSD